MNSKIKLSIVAILVFTLSLGIAGCDMFTESEITDVDDAQVTTEVQETGTLDHL